MYPDDAFEALDKPDDRLARLGVLHNAAKDDDAVAHFNLNRLKRLDLAEHGFDPILNLLIRYRFGGDFFCR